VVYNKEMKKCGHNISTKSTKLAKSGNMKLEYTVQEDAAV
jgi:hypothetical protein